MSVLLWRQIFSLIKIDSDEKLTSFSGCNGYGYLSCHFVNHFRNQIDCFAIFCYKIKLFVAPSQFLPLSATALFSLATRYTWYQLLLWHHWGQSSLEFVWLSCLEGEETLQPRTSCTGDWVAEVCLPGKFLAFMAALLNNNRPYWSCYVILARGIFWDGN